MRRAAPILALLLLAGLLVLLGAWWLRSSPDRATDFLENLGLDRDRVQGWVTRLGGQVELAEERPLQFAGTIEGEEVAVVSELGGRIVALHADEGDAVRAGDRLVELDAASLDAQLDQARAAVASAQAQLAELQAGTHPAEILAARAQVDQAQAQAAAAERTWRDIQAILEDPQEIKGRIVEAQAALDLARAQIEQAQAQVAAAEAQRDPYRAQGSMEEKKLYAVYDAQVRAAQAALEAARATVSGAEDNLTALKALRDHPLALLSQLHLAQAGYDQAVLAAAAARAKLAELQAGPTPEDLAVAQAQVARAQAAQGVLEAQAGKLTLVSPIDGVVAARPAQPGEVALAGAVLMTVADLEDLNLVVYVPEDQLGSVHLGQEAEIEVDSYPGRRFVGRVTHISEQAAFTPTNAQTAQDRAAMVFAVTIGLPNPDGLLKRGLPADAFLR